MQQELGEGVSILGVNETGYDSGNADFTEGRDLPWLQDEADVDAWSLWSVTFRDLIILDGENVMVGVYNLTEHDLALLENYQALKAMLQEQEDLDTAGG